ncbi:MAG: DegT/DnrJ/EryC1/StrS family aminotransferase [Candidatus Paceibacterota bacterium]|jgi:dTDP-4-amino-4,6-dideoxygalactose transaminase
MISLFYPNIRLEECLTELRDTLGSKMIGEGPKVRMFEQEFEKHLEIDSDGLSPQRGYAVALNSCTSALHLAYVLLNLKEGDEVITPVLTCSATNMPLLRRRVKIVFADIKNDLTIDPEDVKRKITDKTRAIIAVDFGGKYCDYKALKEFGVPIVADMAQSVSHHPEVMYSCYSFQAIKHITTGDGGMLICPNNESYERAKRLRWFGIDRNASAKERHTRQISCDVMESGFKYHMNDIAASLGLVGLRHVMEDLNRRVFIGKTYNEFLDVIRIPNDDYWLYTILVQDRDSFCRAMDEAGIEVAIAHNRNDDIGVFRKFKNDCPNMDLIDKHYICIPMHSKLSGNEFNYVIDKINKWQSIQPEVR